ncbi:MAG: (d)CMP kinase [Actinomycetota bacterium]
MSAFVVAIDGPAGSGKSSVSKLAAARLGFDYLDTGAAYRAVTWYVLETGIDPADSAAVIDALPGFDYSIGTDPDNYSVRVGETDVTAAIREQRVAAAVSFIARVPEVRAHVNGIFRAILNGCAKQGIIAEGRDITTVVAPDAPVRILLTASEEKRAERRAAEIPAAGASDTHAALKARDSADSKVSDFLVAADGVHTVDSTNLDLAQTIDAVVALITQGQSHG